MNIGILARQTGTQTVTIRYYERIGLMPAPSRTASNYRSYGPAHRDRLGFIKRCRDLGFTIEEIRELLDLSAERDEDCAAVDRVAAEHLRAVEQKIADLQQLATELRRISDCCQGGRVAECRIIGVLSGN
jgi:Cu(I)-responsive transcriptional regulator